MSEFLAMGGYGAYVWTAYGVTALSLLMLFVWSWFGARAREAELEQVRKLSRMARQAPPSAVSSAAVHGSTAAIDDETGAVSGTDADAGTPSLAAGDSGGTGS